jgi:hypothetical protein
MPDGIPAIGHQRRRRTYLWRGPSQRVAGWSLPHSGSCGHRLTRGLLAVHVLHVLEPIGDARMDAAAI